MFTAFTQGPRLWITFLLLLVVSFFFFFSIISFFNKTVARGENCYLPCGHLQAFQ